MRNNCTQALALSVIGTAMLMLTSCAPLRPKATPRDEIIRDMQHDVQVRPDGSLIVKETIAIRTEGVLFKRGIWRNMYADRIGPHGTERLVFQLLDVSRDGENAPHEIRTESGGPRLYIGDDTPLPPGEHTFVIEFRVASWVDVHEEASELAWSLTDAGWPVPIETASATFVLPLNALPAVEQAQGADGPVSAGTKNLDIWVERGRFVRAQSRKRIPPGRILKVSVEWRSGPSSAPEYEENAR